MTPELTRLIRATPALLDLFGTRTEDGRRITAEWGKASGHCPDSDEYIYEPTFTATDDGMSIVPTGGLDAAWAAAEHALGEYWRIRSLTETDLSQHEEATSMNDTVARATWTCRCGRTVLWKNRANHLLRKRGKHGDPPPAGDLAHAAELVCLMVGWTGSGEGERDKALHEVWVTWHRLYEASGGRSNPRAHPELSDERIREMAAQRDATVARTLDRFFQAPDAEPVR